MINSKDKSKKDKSKKDKSPIRLDTKAAILTSFFVLIILFGTLFVIYALANAFIP
jgi:hypothetical protein